MTQLIYRFELAQVVARRIIKQQRFFLWFESHWLLFFIPLLLFFLFIFRGVGVRSVEEMHWANDVAIREVMDRLIITVASSDEDTDTA